MKRFLILVLCLCMLPMSARAEDEKLVALTFDDGPSGRFTRMLLDGLAQREVKATFFLCGYRIETYPELTQRIAQEGHEIGLHGYSHQCMQNMGSDNLEQEMDKTMALLPSGCQVTFLRTPGGITNQRIKNSAAERGLSLLNWSVDPRDWATKDAAYVQAHVVSHISDGDVILMHDMSDSSVSAALAIVDQLQAQGFRFVTASELAKARNAALTPGKLYYRFAG